MTADRVATVQTAGVTKQERRPAFPARHQDREAGSTSEESAPPTRSDSDVYEVELMSPEELAEQEHYVSTLPPGYGIRQSGVHEFDLAEDPDFDLDSLLPPDEASD